MTQRSSIHLDWRPVLDTGPYPLVLLKDPNNVDVYNNSHDIPFLEIECVVYYYYQMNPLRPFLTRYRYRFATSFPFYSFFSLSTYSP